jgi:hypothetical protein
MVWSDAYYLIGVVVGVLLVLEAERLCIRS